MPKLPTIQPNYGRLFPQVFQGALLTSGELSGLSLNLGRLTEVSQRNEAGTSDLAPVSYTHLRPTMAATVCHRRASWRMRGLKPASTQRAMIRSW